MTNQTIRIILTSYVTVLVALLIIAQNISSHKKRFEVVFTYDMDFAFYQIAKTIAEAKDEIYDYKNTLEILYHDKKQVFTKPVLTYQQHFMKLEENIEYLEKLLQKSIFMDSFRKRLSQNYETLQRVSRVLRSTHIILIFLTLGIAKIWTPAK